MSNYSMAIVWSRKLRKQLPPSGRRSEPVAHTVRLENLSGIKLWSLEERNLYSARVRLRRGHATAR